MQGDIHIKVYCAFSIIKPYNVEIELSSIVHYIILNNGILKSNSSIFPRSEGYITQYTPYTTVSKFSSYYGHCNL